ncbi:unnamed protein product [Pleuronectes platessa]|uniref:Uncharacterized protein n=1 Tax=Pleuronectes platessa TaxID=8262 RepID=A0A9N7VU42_PLEPL|nr:unnamed protein product [Pleuronectes platessa]
MFWREQWFQIDPQKTHTGIVVLNWGGMMWLEHHSKRPISTSSLQRPPQQIQEDERPPADEDKPPLHPEALALGGGECQGSGNETATPLQPLDRMKKEREPGVAGLFERGWEQHLRPEWKTQASRQQQSEAWGGTQGLLFPLRSLSPQPSLVFPQQTVGTMKAACSPPLAQRAVNTGPIRP